MTNVKRFLKSSCVRKDGTAPLYLIVTINGKRVWINTKLHLPPEDFNYQRQLINPKHPLASDYDLIVGNMEGQINGILVRYRLKNVALTPELFREELEKPSKVIDLYGFLIDAIHERKGEITESSIRQHMAMVNKLREFKPNLVFSQVDEDLVKRFDRWLKNVKKNQQNTRHNTIKRLRAYMNIAHQKGLVDKNPLVKLPVRKVTTLPEFLTEGEIEQLVNLYDKKFLPEKYQRILRRYLFGVATGMRVSDIKRVEWEDIYGNLLVFIMQKSRNQNPKKIRIPLNRLAWRMIEDESKGRTTGLLFSSFTEQDGNKKLKDIAEQARIPKAITWHTARHTFATYFLQKTKNLPALQKILGHSRITETMVYAHVLTEDITREMEVAFGNVKWCTAPPH